MKTEKSFTLCGVMIDPATRTAAVNGQVVALTAQEFALLRALLLHHNKVLSREKLLRLAWGMDFLGDSRTVDVHIQKLRKKLGFEDRIQTVYRVGYRLVTGPQ